MRHEKSQTKIVATIGPACSSKEVLRKMFIEGIDVCRLNFSHGSHDDHLKVIKIILELNKELKSNVAILADLQGPKLRIGNVENNMVLLEDGREVTFVTKETLGTAEKLYMSYQEFPADCKPGDTVLIDDGKIKLQVLSSNGKSEVRAKIIHGGPLSSKKGVNLPDTKISQPSLTEKDIRDVEFALEHDVDWVALSFVRSVTDIVELKQIVKKKKKTAGVIAKIEKPEALTEIDNIIDMSDGIMVARGDLGVEVPFDRVPVIQKQIVRKCIEKAKPVIIATQMMESMIENFRPTRAEANDVANAVMDGADAVMLSGETSVGKYPVDVINTMQKLIDYTEQNGFVYNREHAPRSFNRTFLPDSICANASQMSSQVNAKAIVTFTHSGYTAFRVSSHRPRAHIFVFTHNKNILRKMSLAWGVRAFHFDKYEDIDESIEYSIHCLKKADLIHDDDLLVHVGSTPLYKRGRTNMMKLSYV